MKSLPNSLGIPLAIFVAFMLSGCLKAIETIRENPGEEIKVCRVEKILTTFQAGADDLFHADPFEVDFDYNSAGQPIDILASWDLRFPQDYYHFRYDKYGRLRDYMDGYSRLGVILWHRYTYLPKNMVLDSLFAYGSSLVTDANPEQEQFDYITTFQFDAKGRVAKAILGLASDPGAFVTNYVYDARGNLVRPGITYDHKVNPYRTSSTFMFVYQDYSVNNPSTTQATAYNAYGLPTDITGYGLFGQRFSPSTIQYSCSMAWK